MAKQETIQQTFGLQEHLALQIATTMDQDEELITNFGKARLRWLKEKSSEAGNRFLAVTTLDTTLKIYVLTNRGIGVINFEFEDGDPLDKLWCATISAQFNTLPRGQHHIVSLPHRPN